MNRSTTPMSLPMSLLQTVLVAGALLSVPSWVMAESRGELLYSTHCIACHTTQMHWRDQRLATDFDGLKGWVNRWQTTLSLAWSDDDILAVTRHLNRTYYGFVPTGERRSDLATPPVPGEVPRTASVWRWTP
jgi:hypothetical protein